MNTILLIWLYGIKTVGLIGFLCSFAIVRGKVMEKWGVAVAESYLGMSLEEYHKQLKQQNTKE